METGALLLLFKSFEKDHGISFKDASFCKSDSDDEIQMTVAKKTKKYRYEAVPPSFEEVFGAPLVIRRTKNGYVILDSAKLLPQPKRPFVVITTTLPHPSLPPYCPLLPSSLHGRSSDKVASADPAKIQFSLNPSVQLSNSTSETPVVYPCELVPLHSLSKFQGKVNKKRGPRSRNQKRGGKNRAPGYSYTPAIPTGIFTCVYQLLIRNAKCSGEGTLKQVN